MTRKRFVVAGSLNSAAKNGAPRNRTAPMTVPLTVSTVQAVLSSSSTLSSSAYTRADSMPNSENFLSEESVSSAIPISPNARGDNSEATMTSSKSSRPRSLTFITPTQTPLFNVVSMTSSPPGSRRAINRFSLSSIVVPPTCARADFRGSEK